MKIIIIIILIELYLLIMFVYCVTCLRHFNSKVNLYNTNSTMTWRWQISFFGGGGKYSVDGVDSVDCVVGVDSGGGRDSGNCGGRDFRLRPENNVNP